MERETSNEKQPGAPGGRPAPAGARTRQAVLLPFKDAFYDLLKALEESRDEPRRRLRDARQSRDRSLGEAYADAYRQRVDFYRSYGQTLEEARQAEGGLEQATQAHNDYLERLRESQDAVEQAEQQTQREYRDAWDALCGDVTNAIQKAWRQYLEALRDAWARADLDALDPEAATAVGQSAVAAAERVAWELDRWR